MAKSIPELLVEKERLQKKRDAILMSIGTFIGSVLTVGYLLFGRGAP